eukprot:gene22611-27291_t
MGPGWRVAGSPDWGGLSSGSGAYYHGLQGNTGSTFSTTNITGLTSGSAYTVALLTARRPDYSCEPDLGVSVD